MLSKCTRVGLYDPGTLRRAVPLPSITPEPARATQLDKKFRQPPMPLLYATLSGLNLSVPSTTRAIGSADFGAVSSYVRNLQATGSEEGAAGHEE